MRTDALLDVLIIVGAAVTAAYGIWRYAVRPIAAAIAAIAAISRDWSGTGGDPGHVRVPGVMERLVSIENEVKYNGGTRRLADVVKDVEQVTHRLEEHVDANVDGIEELRHGQADAREAAEKAAALAAEVHDEFHEWVETGYVREQTYLSALVDLGIDIEPQPRPDPHHRKDT